MIPVFLSNPFSLLFFFFFGIYNLLVVSFMAYNLCSENHLCKINYMYSYM